MTALTPHSSSPAVRFSRLIEAVRWAPAPYWGETTAERGRFVLYVSGSLVAWTLIGLGGAALLGSVI